MKLEAKSRLVATEVTAAIGDAAPFHSAVLEAGKSLQQAIEVLDSDPKAAKGIMMRACKMVARGMKMTFKGDAGTLDGLEPTVELDNEDGVNTLMGGVTTFVKDAKGKRFRISWEFNLFEDHPEELSVWIEGDVPYNEYKSRKVKGFDLAKYEKIVTRSITAFEKKGFDTPSRFGVGKFGLERQ